MKLLRILLCILLVPVLLLEQPQFSKGRGAIVRPVSPSSDTASVLDEKNNANSSIPIYDIIYNLNLCI